MTDDYIKKKDAYSVLTDYYHHRTVIQHASLTEALNRVPSADVAPVRHGRWVDKGTITDEKAEVITEWQSARCTCCNKYHTTPYLYYFDNFAYCPNCGAKMDEEKDDDTDE